MKMTTGHVARTGGMRNAYKALNGSLKVKIHMESLGIMLN